MMQTYDPVTINMFVMTGRLYRTCLKKAVSIEFFREDRLYQ